MKGLDKPTDANEAEKTMPSLPDDIEEWKEYLKTNGVVTDDSITLEDCKEAVKVMVGNPNFWRKHATLHPNFSRVKNWLWVHSRYRDQAKTLLSHIPESSSSSSSDGDNDDEWLQTLATAFTKFHKKIESHSEFEDTQLFKYFSDAEQGNQQKLIELQEQHTDIRVVTEIQKALKIKNDNGTATRADGDGAATTTSAESVKTLLQGYVDDLHNHLEMEEQTLVGPWLQLTTEQYKKYRTYLSWTYCFMY